MPRNLVRTAAAWAAGIPISYLLIGFLGDFYNSVFAILLAAFLCHGMAILLTHELIGRAQRSFQNNKITAMLTAAVFVTVLIFPVSIFQMAGRFPALFNPAYFLIEQKQIAPYLLSAALTFPLMVQLHASTWRQGYEPGGFIKPARSILPGLALAGTFFFLYLLTASIFNQPAFDVDDIFFDADGLLWRMRFATPEYRDYYWRAVHPYVLLIIRPLVGIVSFLLGRDRLAAAFVLTALTGALCVFLLWYFIKRVTGNNLYALLTAALLGGTTAQWIFSSLIETYIFLAATALIYTTLLLRKSSMTALIITGAVSFGITITNFAQTVIAFITVKMDFWKWVRYGLIVAALTIPLTVLNNIVYPDSQPYFFIPSSFEAEAGNTFSPSIGRSAAVARVMLLHSVAAPDPLVFKAEIPFLKVWMSTADPLTLSKYETLGGKSLAYFWMGLVILGGILFLKNLKQEDNRFPLAMLGILAFNFALHMAYGKDFFLYSANWTYALILFLALAWKPLADKRWFQVTLLLFTALLLMNNSRLIFAMLQASAQHIQ